MKTWRYELPDVNRSGWATVVICEDGFFAAVSDYGNYAYQWTAYGECFRGFLAGIHGGYLLGKIAEKEYDGEETCKEIREYIVRSRRERSLTKEEARSEWDLIVEFDELENEPSFTRFYDATNIDDVWEMECQSYKGDARAFADKTFPRLQQMIKAELTAEREAEQYEKPEQHNAPLRCTGFGETAEDGRAGGDSGDSESGGEVE